MRKSFHCIWIGLLATALWGVFSLPVQASIGHASAIGGEPQGTARGSASGAGVDANASASNLEQDKAPPIADVPPAVLPQLTVIPASEDKPPIPGAILKSHHTLHVSLLEVKRES